MDEADLPHSEFQSQGRFFGGCCRELLNAMLAASGVSIAGAILWGVLLDQVPGVVATLRTFQSQGRFFGGCCARGLA